MWGQSLDDDPTWHKMDYSDAVTRIIASTQIMINNWGKIITFWRHDYLQNDYSDPVTRIIVGTHTGSFEKCFGFLISFGNKDGDIYFLQMQGDDID